jgi:hypothetical protein
MKRINSQTTFSSSNKDVPTSIETFRDTDKYSPSRSANNILILPLNICMRNDILTSNFQQLFRDNLFPPFLLDNNNRERKRKRENKGIMRV